MAEIKASQLFQWEPKQLQAWEALKAYKFLLYGGAGGGGKSFFLRWALINFLIHCFKDHGIKNPQAGLFCEDYPALKDRQLTKIATEVPPWLGKHHADHKSYGNSLVLAPAFGRGILCFRNLDDPSKYASSEYIAIGIDELTKNKKNVFTDLRQRLRWPGFEGMKFLAATNPGGIGHVWVKDMWISKPPKFDPNEKEAHLFGFIQAKATDNSHNPQSYYNTLDSLPEKLRAAFRDGNWDVFEGQYFGEWNLNTHTCKPFEIPSEWERVISIDYGYGAGASSVGFWAIDYGGKAYRYDELYLFRLTYSQLALAILQRCGTQKISYAVGDPAIWGDRPHKDALVGESGGETMGKIFYPGVNDEVNWKLRQEYGIPKSQVFSLQKGDNSRVTGWGRFREYLQVVKDQHGALSPRLQVFNTCTDFIRTIPSLVHSETNPEDVDTDGEDHVADDTRLFLMSRPIAPTAVKPSHPMSKDEMVWKHLDKVRQGMKQKNTYDSYLGSEG